MVKPLGWAIAIAFLSLARAASAADPPAERGVTSASPPAPTNAHEERAFEAALRRHERLAAFTKKLVERAFDEATERFARYSELTRTLAEQARAREEKSFDDEVALYLRKRELTERLTARASVDHAQPIEPSLAAPVW